MRKSFIVLLFIFCSIFAVREGRAALGFGLARQSSQLIWRQQKFFVPAQVDDALVTSDQIYAGGVLESGKLLGVMWVMDPAYIRRSIDWNVGDFTGLVLPKSALIRKRFQRGGYAYGSSAIQFLSDSVGLWNNPETVYPVTRLQDPACAPDVCKDIVRMPSSISPGFDYVLSNVIQPWMTDTDQVVASFEMQIPVVEYEGGVPFVNFAYLLEDVRTGAYIWYLIQIYDVRGFVGGDGADTNKWGVVEPESRILDQGVIVVNDCEGIPYPLPHCYKEVIGSAVLPGMKYATMLSGSAMSTGHSWRGWRRFRFSISGEQIRRVIFELKHGPAVQKNPFLGSLCDDPSCYRIVEIAIHNEIAIMSRLYTQEYLDVHNKENDHVSIGMSIRRGLVERRYFGR